MTFFPKPLHSINSLADAGRNRALSRLGDAFVNCAYSLAISQLANTLDGEKVNRTILAQALKDAGLRSCALRHANSHNLADAAKALIAYAYFKGDFSIEYLADILVLNMKEKPFATANQKIQAATWGFTAVLTVIKRHFESQEPKEKKA